MDQWIKPGVMVRHFSVREGRWDSDVLLAVSVEECDVMVVLDDEGGRGICSDEATFMNATQRKDGLFDANYKYYRVTVFNSEQGSTGVIPVPTVRTDECGWRVVS